MTYLVKGGNVEVSSDRLDAVIVWRSERDELAELDVAAFLLLESRRVASGGDMVFYNQEQSSHGEVRLAALNQYGDNGRESTFSLDLERIPDSVEIIALTASIPEEISGSFADLSKLEIKILSRGKQVIEFAPPVGDSYGSAMILAEFYRHQDGWKFRALGQDYEGKLGGLAKHFAVEVAEESADSSSWEIQKQPSWREPEHDVAPQPVQSHKDGAADGGGTASPAEPQAAPEEIVLTLVRPSLKLSQPGKHGDIWANLNWRRHRRRFLRRPVPVDLDLGCLFERIDGQVGVVQALGGHHSGQLERFPFIRLSGDDRTGEVSQGEWLQINGRHWQDLRRLLVFAFIHDQVTNWPAVRQAGLSLHASGNPPISIKIEVGESQGMCAVALLENADGDMLIKREMRYFTSHSVMDRIYGWGIEWKKGRKQ